MTEDQKTQIKNETAVAAAIFDLMKNFQDSHNQTLDIRIIGNKTEHIEGILTALGRLDDGKLPHTLRHYIKAVGCRALKNSAVLLFSGKKFIKTFFKQVRRGNRYEKPLRFFIYSEKAKMLFYENNVSRETAQIQRVSQRI